MQGSRKPRKIILLSDGTGNSAAKAWHTNVRRVFETLDLSEDDQVACYDDGVGSGRFRPLALLAGAVGFGLQRNILTLYKFACRNHRHPGDQIYGFGFSRGAFTIRVVTQLILDQGLIPADTPEQELHRKALVAYRAYKARRFSTKWQRFLNLARLARYLKRKIAPSWYEPGPTEKEFEVRFLGLWDTVSAYGLPIKWMSDGISFWIWPLLPLGQRLDKRVTRACHALALDDDRASFHPVLWDEAEEQPLVAEDGKSRLGNERISQVWFAGAHSNVGGGYPDDSLAKVSLNWIQNEAKSCGLRFKTDPSAGQSSFKNASIAKDKDGRIYEPREGFGCYYRYAPRVLSQLGKDFLLRNGAPTPPKIHESVLQRIQNRARPYAPLGIPGCYEVVTENDDVLTVGSNPYETQEAASRRELKLRGLSPLIAWRKVAHAVTVLTTLLLVAFPLFQQAGTSLTAEERFLKGFFDTVGEILPAALSIWINGFQQSPVTALALFGLLGVSLAGGAFVARRIRHVADLAWRADPAAPEADDAVPTSGDEERRLWIGWGNGVLERHVMPALFALFAIYLGLAAVNGVLFTVQDQMGYGCNAHSSPEQLSAGDYISGYRDTANFCNVFGSIRDVPNKARDKCNEIGYAYCSRSSSKPEDTERCEEVVKTSCKTQTAENCDTIDMLLESQEAEKNGQKNKVIALPYFKTKEYCQGLGVKVAKGRKYFVRLDGTETFRDMNGAIDAQNGFGFALSNIRHWASLVLGLPFRRSLNHNWFQVILRIGAEDGHEEFLLPDIENPRYLYSQVIEAKADGELFIYVNDAIIGFPWWRKLFYDNNMGGATVLVKQIN